MRATDFIIESSDRARAWIKKVYDLYPHTWENNHVMLWGEGENQQIAMFELVPSTVKKDAVEVKWFSAYPLRQGVGSRAMKELQRLAQEDGIALTLYAWDKGQVSRAKLMKFYKQMGYASKNRSPVMSWEPSLDEDWRNWVTGLGAASMLAGAGSAAYDAYQGAKKVQEPQAQVQTAKVQQPKVTAPTAKEVNQIQKLWNIPLAKSLAAFATKSGIAGDELAQFLAQTAHETANFTTLKEIGNKKYFRKYDIKFNPAKAKELGNVRPGDGERYKGRGFIQLTGRDNYKRAGAALGLPLEQRPELVERPDVAAKVAVWFWKNRVVPKVDSFADTHQVTKPINPGLRGIKDRDTKYQVFKTTAPPPAPRSTRI